jgi:hypothetical protein
MATITQTIPNLYQGISQYPDEQKVPGQVRNAENVVPDLIDGLTKRPGLEFVKTLENVQTAGNWFQYYRDEDEGSYVGQVARDGNVRVWRCSDGVEMTITESNSPDTYLTHTADGDIQALTINDTTFLTNRTTDVEMGTATATARPDTHSAFVELKQILPRRSYALNVYNNDTYAEEQSARIVSIDEPGFSETCSSEDCAVEINKAGSRIYTHAESGIVVRVTCVGQSYIGHVSGHDNHTHSRYYVSYTVTVDLLYGGSWDPDDETITSFNVSIEGRNHQVDVDKINTSSYRRNLERIRPTPIDVDTANSLDATGILAGITAEFDTIDATIIGNGIYLTHDSAFNVEALDGDLFNIITDTVNDVSELPSSCKHGFIVKVTNSSELTEDDYYLKFVGDNDRDGPGHWEECAEPGITTSFDAATMPYVLKRTGATTMTLDQYSWGNREVGDNNTNKTPSFVDNKISKLLFHRDRLAVLSGSNLILSQPGNLGNFWNKTALTFSGVDRIDISCSSSSPNALVDGIEMNTGLILFSATAQYLFTTDSDILNPETAKIYTLSTYNYNINVSPISLGTSLAFIDNAGAYSRFFEMFNITRETQPQILENSKTIQRLLPKDIDSLANSRENSFIIACKRGEDKAYGFKYFGNAEKRLQGAWFVWNFDKDITHQFIINDEYYVITDEDELCKIQLMDTASRPFISQDESEFDIHLDYYQSIEASSLSYDSDDDVTTLTLPTDTPLNDDDTVAVIVTETNDNRGRYATGTVSDGTVELTGDWSDDPVKVGREYEMKVELPTIYPTSTKGSQVVADTSGSLIVQRLKLNFGPVGQFITKLERTGKPDFVDTHESAILDGYKANRAPNLDGSFRTIPVYERNTNVSVTISSTHPSPANIESMSWEGEYTNRFYKRI